MTIHPVRMSGLMLGVPQTLEYFQRMQDRITNFVTANSGISYERFMQLAMNTQELVMDVGTVLDGDEAGLKSVTIQVNGARQPARCHGLPRQNDCRREE